MEKINVGDKVKVYSDDGFNEAIGTHCFNHSDMVQKHEEATDAGLINIYDDNNWMILKICLTADGEKALTELMRKNPLDRYKYPE